MFLFIISIVDINYAQHMKFNGISMGETPTVFISKLKAKGFTPSYYSDNILTGDFCSWSNCSIGILSNKDIITSICVIFPGMEKWKDLEFIYNDLKSLLIQKYGNPYKCVEEFQDSCENDYLKLHSIQLDKCNYISVFKTDNGSIFLRICYIFDSNSVTIWYHDNINREKAKQLIIEDL